MADFTWADGILNGNGWPEGLPSNMQWARSHFDEVSIWVPIRGKRLYDLLFMGRFWRICHGHRHVKILCRQDSDIRRVVVPVAVAAVQNGIRAFLSPQPIAATMTESPLLMATPIFESRRWWKDSLPPEEMADLRRVPLCNRSEHDAPV